MRHAPWILAALVVAGLAGPAGAQSGGSLAKRIAKVRKDITAKEAEIARLKSELDRKVHAIRISLAHKQELAGYDASLAAADKAIADAKAAYIGKEAAEGWHDKWDLWVTTWKAPGWWNWAWDRGLLGSSTEISDARTAWKDAQQARQDKIDAMATTLQSEREVDLPGGFKMKLLPVGTLAELRTKVKTAGLIVGNVGRPTPAIEADLKRARKELAKLHALLRKLLAAQRDDNRPPPPPKPPKPPAPTFRFRLFGYDAKKGKALFGSHSFPPRGLDLHMYVTIGVSGLSPGTRSILLDVPSRGRFFLYAVVPPGRDAAQFSGWVPVPLGRWNLTARIGEWKHFRQMKTFAIRTYNEQLQKDHAAIQKYMAKLPKAKQDIAKARTQFQHASRTITLANICEKLAIAYTSCGKFDVGTRLFRDAGRLVRSVRKQTQFYYWFDLNQHQAHLLGIACHGNDVNAIERLGRERLQSYQQQINIELRDPKRKRKVPLTVGSAASHCFEMAERMTLRGKHDLARPWYAAGVAQCKRIGRDARKQALFNSPNYAAKNGIRRK